MVGKGVLVGKNASSSNPGSLINPSRMLATNPTNITMVKASKGKPTLSFGDAGLNPRYFLGSGDKFCWLNTEHCKKFSERQYLRWWSILTYVTGRAW